MGNGSTYSRRANRAMRCSLVGLAAVTAGATPARGQEMVVKNDAVVSDLNFDFLLVNSLPAGSHVGSRLIMPCDGRIVGVQVGWWGSFQFPFVTTEEAIHIYSDNGTFPIPGPELATVIDPRLTWSTVLRPSLNQFRFLDQAGTTPINVPVTDGQAIFVTLELANATNPNPQVGGPSFALDIDGTCKAQGNVFFSIVAGWLNGCAVVPGDIVMRLIVDCDQAGACCLPDGSCQAILPGDCADMGGTFQGEAELCAETSCPQPSGACCIESTMGCVNLTQVDCATVAGTWQGAGTACAMTECFPDGACCLAGGSCIDSGNMFDCAALSGTFQGPGTTCAGAMCAAPCEGDTDDSDDVDVSDLLDLLAAWGPCPPPCPPDIDASGSVDVSDLLTLLANWGPCP